MNRTRPAPAALLLFFTGAMSDVRAAGSVEGVDAGPEGFNIIAASIFVFFIAVTLVITWWAARNTRNTRDFYAAGGRITGFFVTSHLRLLVIH